MSCLAGPTRLVSALVFLTQVMKQTQSHIIEFKGMINNHAFTILIDSRAIHSYIDPKIVEIFQL
jgi:hypothetical protein